MVTPDKSRTFDDLYTSSNSPSSTKRVRKKRGGWSRNTSTDSTDKKVQESKAVVKVQKEVKIMTPGEQQRNLDQKKVTGTQDDKKVKVVAAPVLVESNDLSLDTLSTSSHQLFAKVADIVEAYLPIDQEEEASQILQQSDDQILSWFVTLLKSKSDDQDNNSVPLVDPKVYEELQETNAKLTDELQRQSTAVSSLKQVVSLHEQEKKELLLVQKELLRRENQAKLHVIGLSQSVKKLNQPDDSQLGDKVTDEYIIQTTEELAQEVSGLEKLYGLSSENSESDNQILTTSSSTLGVVERNIPSHEEVTNLFKDVSVLHSQCNLEVQKLETKDKRPPEKIHTKFVEMLQTAQSLATTCMELRKDLVKDIDTIQEKISVNTVPNYDKDQRRGVEIISKLYSEDQFSQDIQKHSMGHNRMRSDLKDVVTHHERIVEMLGETTHNIGLVLMDWEDDKFFDTMMEMQSILNKLPIDIQSITIPEVKESVVKAEFKHIHEAINTFQVMARKKRKALMGLTVPSDETLKQKHIDGIKHLADQQKLHLKELAKTWDKISPHVKKRVDELEQKVAEGNQNVKLSSSVIQTVANYEATTPDDYEQDKILPYETDHEERKKALHQLKSQVSDLQAVAELAKQEANRTYDAFKRNGYWTTETRYSYVGNSDKEVDDLFKKEEDASAGWRLW